MCATIERRPCCICDRPVTEAQSAAWGDGQACCRECYTESQRVWIEDGNPPDDCLCGCEGDIETHRSS